MSGVRVSRVRLHEDATVRVTVDPYTSVLALACAAASARYRGQNTAIGARLSGREMRAVSRLVVPGSSLAPEALTPAAPERDTTVVDELDRLRSMSADDLHTDLDVTYGGDPPRHWSEVAGTPREWLADMSAALETVWRLVEPAWKAQDRRRRREVERVGVAAARGALGLVLAKAHPRGRIVDGALEFPDPEGTVLDDARTVVLAPLLSGVDISISNLDRPGVAWFGYPAPMPGPDDEPGLSALLTPVRATLLRLLGRSWTMSRLAAAVGMAPATATHQIAALVADGLVERRRDGRHTLVERTDRGAALLDLYGVPDLPGHVPARSTASSPGARPSGGAAPGGAAPGGTAPGGATPGGAIRGGAAPGGAMRGGTAPGGATPGGAVPGGATPGGTAPGATARAGRPSGAPVQGRVARSAPPVVPTR